jgi:hypothetical protein
MEGKRVKYKVSDFNLKVETNRNFLTTGIITIESCTWKEKFGTIVGLFENGKVCVKCDEDKLLRLFDIEMLEVVDEDIENFTKGDKI